MVKVVYISFDDRVAIYVDGKLKTYCQSYEINFREGLEFCEKYGVPGKNFEVEYKIYENLTEESWDKVCEEIPKNYDELEWV